jgi:hypothetical protein
MPVGINIGKYTGIEFSRTRICPRGSKKPGHRAVPRGYSDRKDSCLAGEFIRQLKGSDGGARRNRTAGHLNGIQWRHVSNREVRSIPTERLTERNVDSRRPGDRPFIVVGIDLKGFGVRVSPISTMIRLSRPGTRVARRPQVLWVTMACSIDWIEWGPGSQWLFEGRD